MKELDFNLKLATPHEAGFDHETMTPFQVLLQEAVDRLSTFLNTLPPAPIGYKWTWDTVKDGNILRLQNFRLVQV